MFDKIKAWLRISKLKLNVYDVSLLLLPILIWFSYQPLISFGDFSGMHIELSIAVIYLALFAIINLPLIFKNWRSLIRRPAVIVAASFVAFAGASLIWTLNPTRGILTFGIMVLLLIAFLAIIANQKLKKLLPALARILIVSAIAISAVGWLQVAADTFNISSDVTLLCAGCVSEMFGFARITAFAIEPQFFGSMLIAPIIILAWHIVLRKTGKGEKLALLFLITTMFLTLSRGAIYALLIGIVLLIILILARHRNHSKKGVIWLVLLLTLGIGLSFVVQGVSATMNTRVNENFTGAITKSIHQLSLGVIDLRFDPEIEHIVITEETQHSETETLVESTQSPVFDGYVENSTDDRLSLSSMALGAWGTGSQQIFFGAGLGSAGYAMHETYPELIGDTEITQNEYTEILLELGLVGLTLFGVIMVGLLFCLRKNNLALAIIVAYLIQWCFFSGYPNALHIYFIMMIFYASKDYLKFLPTDR